MAGLQVCRLGRHLPQPLAGGGAGVVTDEIGLGQEQEVGALQLSQYSPADKVVPRSLAYRLCIGQDDDALKAKAGCMPVLGDLLWIGHAARLDNDLFWRLG